jgi:hypothetical protein
MYLCSSHVPSWSGKANATVTFEYDDDPVFDTMYEAAGLSFVTKNQGVTLQNRRHKSTEPETSISLSIYDLEILNCGFEMHLHVKLFFPHV